MVYAIFIRLLLALLFVGLSTPAQAELYSWRDAEGALHATDRRDKVPEGVTPDVWPDLPPSPPAETPQRMPSQPEAQTPPPPKAPPSAMEAEASGVTQGAFAVQLARELGLEEDATPEEAADLLTRIRVTPRLGRWKLEAPITPALAVRLRALTVSAARRGSISITPEEALLAFDTTAALLNVSLPAVSEADFSDSPIFDSTFLIDPLPPVIILPPPIIHQPHQPPPPRRPDRHLRGGLPGFAGQPTIHSSPPTAFTPLAPPVGETVLTPLAPRLRSPSSSSSVPDCKIHLAKFTPCATFLRERDPA